MNIKYYHDFIGADDVVNRFEILQSSPTASKVVEASPGAFTIEYLEVKKTGTGTRFAGDIETY